jgi:hypothetical protein
VGLRCKPRYGERPLLAEAKKPEYCQDYDDQTNNIDESIHDIPDKLNIVTFPFSSHHETCAPCLEARSDH